MNQEKEVEKGGASMPWGARKSQTWRDRPTNTAKAGEGGKICGGAYIFKDKPPGGVEEGG